MLESALASWSAAVLCRFRLDYSLMVASLKRFPPSHDRIDFVQIPLEFHFKLKPKFYSAVILGLAVVALPLRAAIPIPAQKDYVISLDGTWRFKLEQAPAPPRVLGVSGRPIPIVAPERMEPFYQTDFREDTNWHALRVPGNWEMAGFSPATYNQPDNASGLYRVWFDVPKKWKGRVVKINFDGVQNGCEVWCNGRPVPVEEPSWGRTNYHESGWTAWQADLTDVVRCGAENLLALRVTKNTKSVDCDSGDFFLLGGVHRPVTLFSVPAAHIRDFSVSTKLLPHDQKWDEAEVTVTAKVGRGSREMWNLEVSMELDGPVQTVRVPDSNGVVTLKQFVLHPKLWSAEWPSLYVLALDLLGPDGKVMEHVTRKIGIREVSIVDGVFRVNHAPVKLVGICRHDVYPTLGTAINREVWKKDLTLLKAANFNAVRTSHYPYGSGFYDLCDEMGFYVLDEEPFCWVNCDDPELLPAFEQRAREAVNRDKNHPCVVIWGIGNENRPGRDNAKAAKITRELDPTRPRLISCQHADDGGEHVEFDDAHYVTAEDIHKAEHAARHKKWPMIYTENPNVWEVRNGPDYGCLDLWRPVIQRTWDELWNDDHVTGTFLWEWQDRAVADKCKTKYYYFFPQTGINLVKVKGVVDGFRNPRPEYFHIKMAQSPISIANQPQVTTDKISFEVTNHYSFTDLSALVVKWSLETWGHRAAGGTTHLSLAPASHGTLSINLPEHAFAEADKLRLDIEHPGGWNVLTHAFQLRESANPVPTVKAATELTFPQFNLLTGTVERDGMGWKKLDRKTGELSNVKVMGPDGALNNISAVWLLDLPLATVRTMEADVLLRGESVPIGHVRAEVSDRKFNYHFTWSGEKSDIYELGWIFSAPKGADHFSWSRKADWSYYPSTHIGRPTGTATPDSARVELTKVDRPDAFDFNSTKFNCDWATLTDKSMRGIGLTFSPDQRHHVRGGITPMGDCTLVVDRCYSPPRDISSKVVADLYTVLKKGDEVKGAFQF